MGATFLYFREVLLYNYQHGTQFWGATLAYALTYQPRNILIPSFNLRALSAIRSAVTSR